MKWKFSLILALFLLVIPIISAAPLNTTTGTLVSPWNTNIQLDNPSQFVRVSSLSVQTLNNTWLDFNGLNASVSTPSLNKLNSSSMSFMIWYKYINYGGTQQQLFSTDGDGIIMAVSTGPTNKTQYYLRNASGTNTGYQTGGINVTSSGWHQFVVSYRDGLNIISYLDTMQDKTSTVTLNGPLFFTSTARLGSNYNSANNFLNGSIGGFKIFSGSIEAPEINAHYNSSIMGRNLGKIVPILYFHHINDTYIASTQGITTNTSDFRQIMTFINQSNMTSITSNNYIDMASGILPFPKFPIIIQFDDGLQDNYINAYPIMSSLGLIGEIAIPTNAIQTSTPNNYMNWTQVNDLKNAGWGFSSHGLGASNFSAISNENLILEYYMSIINMQGNISYTPKSLVFPSEQFNSTLMDKCSSYFKLCYSAPSTNSQALYSYSKLNLTSIGGAPRIGNWNETNMYYSKLAIGVESNVILNYEFKENNGTIIYDVQRGLNGTGRNTTYNNDSVLNTLNQNVDYTFDTTNKLLNVINPSLDRSWMYYSLILDLEALQTCTPTNVAGFKLIMIIASLVIVSVMGLYIYNRGIEGFDFKELILIFAVLIIVITLWSVAGQNISGICSPLAT